MVRLTVHDVQRGIIKVRTWRKRTRSGLRHTVAESRLFRNGDVWKKSARSGRDDIPPATHVFDTAHT